ncbi:MAG: A24 family peptidase [Ardenticatenaceae bacterium]|nr:A24 family peptidase [Ardenticatenaceae bacterium]
MSISLLSLTATVAGAVVGVALDRGTPGLPYTVRRRIPARALLLPIAAALVLGWLGIRFSGEPCLLTLSALYSVVYLAVAVIDYETHRIPNVLILPATAAALLLSLPDPRLSWQSALLGAVIAFVVLFLAVVVAERVFGTGAFGMGDAKLGAFIGATTGVPGLIVALPLGIVAAGLAAILLLALGRASRRSYIPYGPFLCLGGWVAMLWGHAILEWWLA